MASTNQRQATRTPVTLKIKFKSETLDQFIERYSVDISQGGIFIRTKEPLPVGTSLRFEFQLKDASPLITGDGTVVWTRDQEASSPGVAPGMGVRFESLPGQSQQVLERILAQKPAKPRRAPSTTPVHTAAGGEFGVESPTRVAPGEMLEGLASKPGGDSGGGFGESPTRVAPGELLDDLASEPEAPASQADGPPLAPRRLDDLPLRAAAGKAGAVRPPDDRTPLPEPMPFSPDADEFGEEAFEESTKVANYEGADLDALRAKAGAAPSAGAADPTGAEEDAEESGAFDDQPTGDLDRDELAASAEGAAESPETGESDVAADDAPPFAADERWADASNPDGWTTNAGGDAPDAAETASDATPAASEAEPDPQPARERSRETDAPPVGSDEAMERARELAMSDNPGRKRGKVLVAILAVAVVGGGGFLAYQRTIGAGGQGGGDDAPRERAAAATDRDDAPAPDAEPAGVDEPGAAPMRVETDPPGATVELVGEGESSTAPAEFGDLDPDRAYDVRVSHPGYRTREVAARPGDAPRVELEKLPRVLSIRSRPPGAAVFIDGERRGSTPTEYTLAREIGDGEPVRVSLRRSGYRAATETIGPNAEFESAGDELVHELRVELSRVPRRPEPEPGSEGGDADEGGGDTGGSGEAGAGGDTGAGGDGEPAAEDPASGGDGGGSGTGSSTSDVEDVTPRGDADDSDGSAE